MTQLMEQRSAETVTPHSNPQHPLPPPAAKSGRLAMIILVILLIAGGLALARRLTERGALPKETERLAIPTVGVTKPALEGSSDELVLPAQLQAYVESAIYARTNGHLLRC